MKRTDYPWDGICQAESPDGLICERPEGHDGSHVEVWIGKWSPDSAPADSEEAGR